MRVTWLLGKVNRIASLTLHMYDILVSLLFYCWNQSLIINLRIIDTKLILITDILQFLVNIMLCPQCGPIDLRNPILLPFCIIDYNSKLYVKVFCISFSLLVMCINIFYYRVHSSTFNCLQLFLVLCTFLFFVFFCFLYIDKNNVFGVFFPRDLIFFIMQQLF